MFALFPSLSIPNTFLFFLQDTVQDPFLQFAHLNGIFTFKSFMVSGVVCAQHIFYKIIIVLLDAKLE